MNSSILIPVITGIIALITAVITSYWTYIQSKRIETLKRELEVQKETDSQIFKFLLSYETDKVNQILIALKEYLTLVQTSKDQIRDIGHNRNVYFGEESESKLIEIRKSIIEQYAKSVYYFNENDVGKNAHTIKNYFLEIIDDIMIEGCQSDQIDILLKKISITQDQLQAVVQIKIEEIISSFSKK